MDYEKAFDNVPHERSLSKASCRSIKGQILFLGANWIKKQTNQETESRNMWAVFIVGEVRSGEPQGSSLGARAL